MSSQVKDAKSREKDVFYDKNCNNKMCINYQQQSSTNKNACYSTLTVVPNGGYGWIIVFASFLVNLISDGIGFSFGVIYIELLEHFGESKAKTAWVGSVFFSVPLICGPIASILVDRFGCRRMTILGGVLASIGFVCSSFANSLEVLFLTFGIITGFGLALSYVAAIVIVSFYFDTRRGLATGLSVCGTGIGTFIFAPCVTYLVNEFSWNGAVLILGAVFLNIVVCGMLMRDLEGITDNQSQSDSANQSLQFPCSQCSITTNENLLVPESERLSNSLFQLPTYLTSSKLSNEFHISWRKNVASNAINSPSLPSNCGSMDLLPKYPVACNGADSGVKRSYSFLSSNSPNTSLKQFKKPQLLALYLESMKFQRNSLTYQNAMLKIHRHQLKTSSCPDIYQKSDSYAGKKCSNNKLISDLKNAIIGLLDPYILSNVNFMIFCGSNFLLYIWYDIPYIYMPVNAQQMAISESNASFLISIIGIFNTIGNILLGYVCDQGRVKSSLLYSVAMLLCGIVTFTIPFLRSYWSQCVVAGLYGFFLSANYALASVIVVDIISLDHFINAYGLLLLGQGIANLIGPPIGGFMFDVTGAYTVSFYSAGVGIFVSGIAVFFLSGMICGSSTVKISNPTNLYDTIVKSNNGELIVNLVDGEKPPVNVV